MEYKDNVSDILTDGTWWTGATLWQRFRLWFKEEQWEHDPITCRTIKYKVLDGEYFILGLNVVPPKHINCRSKLRPVK